MVNQDWLYQGGPWIGSIVVIHGLGPSKCSMDWVSHGDPLICSVKKVPGLGSSGWSDMDGVNQICPGTSPIRIVHGQGPGAMVRVHQVGL